MKNSCCSTPNQKLGLFLNILLDIVAIVGIVGPFFRDQILHATILFIIGLLLLITLTEHFFHISQNKTWSLWFFIPLLGITCFSLFLPPISPLIDRLISCPWWLFFVSHLFFSGKYFLQLQRKRDE